MRFKQYKLYDTVNFVILELPQTFALLIYFIILFIALCFVFFFFFAVVSLPSFLSYSTLYVTIIVFVKTIKLKKTVWVLNSNAWHFLSQDLA